MSRGNRCYYNGAVYHISIRGNNRQMILQKEEDKRLFLECLKKFKERFNFKLFGFVVMDNHVHSVIKTADKVNISKIMQAVTLSYSVRFRHKYLYTGYVWQGRFTSKVIENDGYILNTLEYIHNNPVRAKIVNDPADYPWSSYKLYNERGAGGNDYPWVDKYEG